MICEVHRAGLTGKIKLSADRASEKQRFRCRMGDVSHWIVDGKEKGVR
jgi:hypothetical protein